MARPSVSQSLNLDLVNALGQDHLPMGRRPGSLLTDTLATSNPLRDHSGNVNILLGDGGVKSVIGFEFTNKFGFSSLLTAPPRRLHARG